MSMELNIVTALITLSVLVYYLFHAFLQIQSFKSETNEQIFKRIVEKDLSTWRKARQIRLIKESININQMRGIYSKPPKPKGMLNPKYTKPFYLD